MYIYIWISRGINKKQQTPWLPLLVIHHCMYVLLTGTHNTLAFVNSFPNSVTLNKCLFWESLCGFLVSLSDGGGWFFCSP